MQDRELLDRLQIPQPWRNVELSLALTDELELRIAELTVRLKRQGADHHYISMLVTAPGIGWTKAYTIASEMGDIARFPSPAKLCGVMDPAPRCRIEAQAAAHLRRNVTIAMDDEVSLQRVCSNVALNDVEQRRVHRECCRESAARLHLLSPRGGTGPGRAIRVVALCDELVACPRRPGAPPDLLVGEPGQRRSRLGLDAQGHGVHAVIVAVAVLERELSREREFVHLWDRLVAQAPVRLLGRRQDASKPRLKEKKVAIAEPIDTERGPVGIVRLVDRLRRESHEDVQSRSCVTARADPEVAATLARDPKLLQSPEHHCFCFESAHVFRLSWSSLDRFRSGRPIGAVGIVRAVGDFGDQALLFGVPTGLLFVGPTGRLMHGTP